MNLTNTIRTLRESKGLTQEDLSERLQVTRSNYAYLEGRGNKLTVEQLQKIAEALGVSIVEIITGEPQEREDTERVKELDKRLKEIEYFLKLSELVSEKRLNDLRQILGVFFHDFFKLIIEHAIKKKIISKEDYEGWIVIKEYELGRNNIQVIGMGEKAKEKGFTDLPIDLHLFMSDKQIVTAKNSLFGSEFIGELTYHMCRVIVHLKVLENKEIEKIISYGLDYAFKGNFFVPSYLENFPADK